MLNSKTDYFFVIIFFIVVASFLGMSIVNIIDKKLSNIKINVPKIKLPASEVTVRFEKNGESYKVKCSKTIKKINKQTVDLETVDLETVDLNKPVDLNQTVDLETVNLEKTKKFSLSDYESEDEEEGGEDADLNDSVDNNVKIGENISIYSKGLTAEQFYNTNFINPYVPDYKKINNNDIFEAFNNDQYQ
jgi:hypothetical protein